MRLLGSALLALAWTTGQPASTQSSDLRITGHVLYRGGSPVTQAKVTFWSYAGGSIFQPVTYTDANGAYALTLSQFSEGAVSASKTKEGFPDAVLAFYGRSGYQSFQVIDAKFFSAKRSADLIFGDPQRTIAWKLVDDSTGKPVYEARAFLQAVDNPEITGANEIMEGEAFLLVLPRSLIRITIRSPGYAEQEFIEQDEPGAARNKSFALDKRTIRLKALQLPRASLSPIPAPGIRRSKVAHQQNVTTLTSY